MEADKVVPDVIDVVPSKQLLITYGDDLQVSLGNELTSTQVKDQPRVSWELDSENSFFTLLMVDPDAPTRMAPILRDVKHWLVVNIAGNDLKTGRVLSEYRGSGPPRGTGLHRYIFLLYRQPDGEMRFDESRNAAGDLMGRLRFSTKRFALKYGLGQPVAGNFFKAKWDSNVEFRK